MQGIQKNINLQRLRTDYVEMRKTEVMDMGEKEIMKGNLKISVFDSFPYDELRKICDLICGLGYDAEFCDNGNIVFQKKGTDKK